jgi:hypothetical protein
MYVLKACSKCLRAHWLRFKQIIPDVGPGQVKLGPDIVEYVIAEEKLSTDLVVFALHLPEDAERISTGESHGEQETPEPGNHGDSGVPQRTIEAAPAGIPRVVRLVLSSERIGWCGHAGNSLWRLPITG